MSGGICAAALSEGYIVYYGSDAEPRLVTRIGYGSYLREVRVRRLNEPNTFTAGQWVSYARLCLLEIGDNLVCTKEVEAATEDRLVIPNGTVCRFAGLDDEDDVLLDIRSANGYSRRIVFFEDFRWFSLQ